MSQIKSDVIEKLGDALNAMSVYAGGSIPSTGSTQYNQWVRWVQLAQYDIAKRGFWSRCLTKADLTITKDVNYSILPDDFFKRNGIYVLNVNGDDWASNANLSGQRITASKDSITGKWIVRFINTPTQDAVGELWYFYNPPVPTDQADNLWFDGEMIMFGALKEYFRQSRQPGSQDDARSEYENRFNENLGLEMLPTPQELISWKSIYEHSGINPQSEIHRSSSFNPRR